MGWEKKLKMIILVVPSVPQSTTPNGRHGHMTGGLIHGNPEWLETVRAVRYPGASQFT